MKYNVYIYIEQFYLNFDLCQQQGRFISQPDFVTTLVSAEAVHAESQ